MVHGSDRLLVRRHGESVGAGQELWFLDAAPGGEAEPFRTGRSIYGTADVSADGDLVAYAQEESGQWQIQVESLGTGQRWQVSAAGGEYPRWGPDGNLYYVATPRTMTRVTVDRAAGAAPVFGRPEPVIQLTPTFGITDVTRSRPRTEFTSSPWNASRSRVAAAW